MCVISRRFGETGGRPEDRFSCISSLEILADGEKPARCLPSLAKALALLGLRSGTYMGAYFFFSISHFVCVCVVYLAIQWLQTHFFFFIRPFSKSFLVQGPV